ncbi:hypothetical protein Joe_69 [Streptomyces phage Joe]|uniref:Lipoprotein n=1 Tax=Streptomyces phage Joe TaxID=1913034 RepID=A0A1J0GP11_9CAUD|nr:hypothetical protein KGG94_gp69 [Streptomyces phage Joe]APC43309.1 hypothetical protein Joe_69 [Streptomyces phage Joe]
MRYLRVVGVLILVILGFGFLTGCDDRECIESHTTVQTVTTFNGKTTSVHVIPVTVCTRYAEEK